MVQVTKNMLAMRETGLPYLVWEDPLEKGMATHSSIFFFFFAWRSPWAEERVRHSLTFLVRVSWSLLLIIQYQKYIQESFLFIVSIEVVFLTCSWKIQIENTSLSATSSQACHFRN